MLSLAMTFSMTLPLASIAAVRPVFLIVMGIFLAVIVWRISRTSGTWAARWMLIGALLLSFGYAGIIPLAEAGIISRAKPTWRVITLVVMNGGWLFFGLGIALHAHLIQTPSRRRHANLNTAIRREPLI
jgi:hypothetical protein